MLHEFKNDLSGNDTAAPPFVIRASNLDKNFQIVSIMESSGNNSPYRVVRPAGGDGPYKLEPQKVFDVCENGKPVKYAFFASRVVQE